MSDFDKEAERERLREKYEAEREDREATQHMSELLLKGATMTNSHCGRCGDPIFRYDGQEFCPSCNGDADAETDQRGTDQQTADQQTASRQSTDQQEDAGADAIEVQTEPTPSPDSDASTNAPAADAPTDPTSAAEPASATELTPATPSSDARGDAPDRNADAVDRGHDPVATDGDAVGNVEATLERFAAAAARTDDPDRAREYLAVVRDATDTLDALDR
ncbi:hypothetical protein G9C85_08775 [Halorubellus sp. JP-L1]|uniref:Sjogren's syndrome/scleroderma autoantigen 1 family protein n=1 Tax=Halorubellus sp. JP-L1 TaxID=2715753 RepID=UPI0014080192|nr:Sjogren's syndrome/scleroderma autoantigen 1 family protein [Halorubellus sp. JP-L1]NHN41723.1 hypothetical protein [Halorubellus sp. JP-L1]